MLTEAQAESAQRIAMHCAHTNRGLTPRLSMSDRYEAALDGIVEYLHLCGWPDGSVKPLYRAAGRGIDRAAAESVKHIRRWSYWYNPPGNEDSLAEAVTDRIGVWQVVWSLTEKEWAALWAVAEVMKRDGSREDAAALLGISMFALTDRLKGARRKCRTAWLVPGETAPRGIYHARRDGRRSKADTARSNRKYRKKAT